MTYSLVLLNPVAYNILEFAKAHIEWCGQKIIGEVEKFHRNPFDFSFINTLHNLEDLENIPKPCVVMASSLDLESGFARELFIKWSENPENLVLLLNKSYGGIHAPSALANKLIWDSKLNTIELYVIAKYL